MLKALFCSTCIFLLTGFSASRLYASDYFSNACRIYTEGRYFEASIEFERAIFYETDSSLLARNKYYKSLCYKSLAEYDKALTELKTINLKTLPDTLWLMISYEEALCSYLDEDIDEAMRYIEEIKLRSSGSLNNPGIIQLNIICLNSRQEWDKAMTLWYRYIDSFQVDDSAKYIFKKEIANIYAKENLPRLYSASKAKLFSSIIPGSGQIYCGAISEGMFNLLINASLLGYTVWEFYSQYYFTGYFIGLRFFKKFYTGGINRANNLAVIKNKMEITEFNSESSSLMLRINVTDSQ